MNAITSIFHRITSLLKSGLLVVLAMLTLHNVALADFRFLPIGARPQALGSAFVAVADDPNAVYWNPAGLVRDDRLALTLTRSWLFGGVDNVYNDQVNAKLPSIGSVHLGVGWVRLGINDIYSENTLSLASAMEMPFMQGLSLGLTGKMFLLEAPGYEQYNDPSFNGGDHAFTFDLGFLYDSGNEWTLGGAMYNVTAPELQLLENTSNPDPAYREWALGGSYLFREILLVTADVRNREGDCTDMIVHGGSEIWFFDALVLRTGLHKGMVTLGAGLQDKNWEADFSIETNNKLGNIYMLSFTLRN